MVELNIGQEQDIRNKINSLLDLIEMSNLSQAQKSIVSRKLIDIGDIING